MKKQEETFVGTKLTRAINEIISFVSISGIGWLIDFSIYTLCTVILGISVFSSNCLGAIPAVTFVFFMNTRFTFKANLTKEKLYLGYIIYGIYQIILLIIISGLSQYLYDSSFINEVIHLNSQFNKIIIKICLTPITMCCNYFFMKHYINKVTS